MTTNKSIFIIIYIIGYIVSYILLRRMKRREYGQAYYSWEHVLECIVGSLFSWFSVVTYVYLQLLNFLDKIITKYPKPPKFL